MELENIPFAGNNPEYKQLLEQISATMLKYFTSSDETKYRKKLCDLEIRRRAMEISFLDTARLIARLSSTDVSARLAEAIRLFEAGDNKGANAVLNLDVISRDADANAARVDAAGEEKTEFVKALESNIAEYKMKIKTLQNAMEEGWVAEVRTVYEQGCRRSTRPYFDR